MRNLVNPEEKRAFGAKIRALRKAAGKTLDDVASLLGISAVHVSNVERGDRHPFGPEHTEKLAEMLGGDSLELLRLAAEARGAFELPTAKMPERARDFVAGLVHGEWHSDDFWAEVNSLRGRHCETRHKRSEGDT